jgi:hypothetical protein
MAATTISGESLRKLGGAGAILETTVLCVGIVGLIVASPDLRPWLVVLFGINAALGGMTLDALGVISAIDIVVLALAAIALPASGLAQANRTECGWDWRFSCRSPALLCF